MCTKLDGLPVAAATYVVKTMTQRAVVPLLFTAPYAWVRRTRTLYTVDVPSGRVLHQRTVPPARVPWLLVPEGAAGYAD